MAVQGWEYDPTTGELDRTFATRVSDFATLANLDYEIDGIGRVLQLATTTRRVGTTSSPLESRTFNVNRGREPGEHRRFTLRSPSMSG